MKEYERRFVEEVIDTLSASIASGMRESDARYVEDGERLTPEGREYVRGYLTGRLSMLRSGAVGNPNLSADDVEEIATIVEEHEAAVAADLYA